MDVQFSLILFFLDQSTNALATSSFTGIDGSLATSSFTSIDGSLATSSFTSIDSSDKIFSKQSKYLIILQSNIHLQKVPFFVTCSDMVGSFGSGIFGLKPASDKDGVSTKRISQIGPVVPEEIGYTHIYKHTYILVNSLATSLLLVWLFLDVGTYYAGACSFEKIMINLLLSVSSLIWFN